MRFLRFLPLLFALPLLNHAQTGDFPLTNHGVIELVGIRIHNSELARVICTAPTFNFDLTPSGGDQLSRGNVSDDLIRLMAMRQHGLPCTPDGYGSGNKNYGPRETLILPSGTDVRLRLAASLTSDDAKTGDRIRFEVLDDVIVNHRLVIERGAISLGTITAVQHNRRLGRGDRLGVTIDSVLLANGGKIALTGVNNSETTGGGNVSPMVVATALTGDPLFLLLNGKDARTLEGKTYIVQTDGAANLDGLDFEYR